jgi:hypothetical protein
VAKAAIEVELAAWASLTSWTQAQELSSNRWAYHRM